MNTILILSACLYTALARPEGPPVGVCSSMAPGHGDPTVTAANPYMVTLNSTTYGPETAVRVTIGSDTSTQFRGFFVQARVNDEDFVSNPALGMFSDFSPDTGGVLCDSMADSAWGHINPSDKMTAQAVWMYDGGECEDVGTLAFRVSVVQGNPATRYYTDIVSDNLNFYMEGCPTAAPIPTTDAPTGGAGYFLSSIFTIVTSIVMAVLAY